MNLPVPYPIEPMEAEPVEELPSGPGWQYEPKWDGFRAIVFRDGDELAIQSRNGKPLGRYFPELVRALLAPRPRKFVLDGEIMLFVDGKPSFETLQLRLHPAATRVDRLAEQHPVTFVAFDLLVDAKGNALLARPLKRRRSALESFMSEAGESAGLQLSPATTSRDQALTWLELVGSGLDGIVAKRLDQAYQPGRRAMQKYKLWRTVDCVVAGVYLDSRGEQVQSVLLGLYDDDGKLHYVGRSTLHADAPAITRKLMPLIGGTGLFGPVARRQEPLERAGTQGGAPAAGAGG